MSDVLYEQTGSVGVLTLNRPDKLNAVNTSMRQNLHKHLAQAAANDSIRVVILEGAGRAFSAGFDLEMGDPPAGQTADEFTRSELHDIFELIMTVLEFPKPVIAAVHGYCLGSSMEMSAVCDITIAAEDCRFGAPEVRFGSGIVCLILPWIVGQKNAREMLLTGSNRIGAARAQAIGLVNQVVPNDELRKRALELAREIAMNDPLAVRLTKQAINRGLDVTGVRKALEDALAIDVEIETTETEESREFNRILDEEGPKAALAWRAEQLPPGD